MITIKEIAKLSGYSIATVNRALYDKGEINSATKEKIKAIAREQGYRPHLMARSLAKGRTNTIGLIVLDIQNPFFGQLINLLDKMLQKEGYTLHLGIMDGTPESEYRVLEQMAGYKVDGIIHFPINIGDEYKRYLKTLHIPIIHLCNWLDDEFPFVGVKEKESIHSAVNYIKKLEYERIIYVSPPLRYLGSRNLFTLEQRLRGVEESANPLELHIITNTNYISDTADFISKDKKRSCVLCSNDIFALDIMTALKEKNRIPPRDYGIIGYDNLSVLRHITPKLTTIAYPMEELASNAMENLIGLMNGKSPDKCLLEASLIPGHTV